jgi:biopolymer transport protein TolQ
MLSNNPLFDSYLGADPLGRGVFLALFFLSVLCWALSIQKYFLVSGARKKGTLFKRKFQTLGNHIFSIELSFPEHPIQTLYLTGKKATLEQLSRNSELSQEDFRLIRARLSSSVSEEMTRMQRKLHLLLTSVSLAPFLGLLGTVWGILLTLSELQNQGSMHSGDVMLGGLSMALGTTVVGLIVAIPALVAYNFLRAQLRSLEQELEDFSHEMSASIEVSHKRSHV